MLVRGGHNRSQEGSSKNAGGGLMGKLNDMLGGRARASNKNTPRPASEDPYGDPADEKGGGRSVKPASAYPYGDLADEPRRR